MALAPDRTLEDMMWLFEDPLPTAAIGALAVVILVSGFLKTGRVVILWAIAVVMGLTALLLAVEQFSGPILASGHIGMGPARPKRSLMFS